MNTDGLIERMIAIVAEGGRLALSLINDSAPSLKPDRSVLTKADGAVSRMARERLADLLQTGEHILVDEEDENNAQYFRPEIFNPAPQKSPVLRPVMEQCGASGRAHGAPAFRPGGTTQTPFIWSIDPIDGTRPYSNRMPLFGVSLGLLKERRPFLGVVYFPSLGELFVADGKNAYFVEKAFTSQEKRTEIVPLDQTITPQSVYFISDNFFKNFSWDYGCCPIMAPSCAVVDLCWPSIGRGCGCFFNANLWDFAGAWPILRAAGLDMRALTTGQVLEQIEREHLIGDAKKTWFLKDYFVVSSARNFPILQQAISAKK